MAMVERADEVVGLTEAAAVIGVHRATVNDMVLSRRLRARRRRGRWVVDRQELERFAGTYQRPANAPEPRDPSELSETAVHLLSLLVDWGDATVAELTEVIRVHDGNVRKQLRILMARELAEREDSGSWRATD